MNDDGYLFKMENGHDRVCEFVQSLRPGDRVRWDDRARDLTVYFVDPTGEYVPAGMDHWEYTMSAHLTGQGDSHFRLCVLNGGRTLRVYRLTSFNWDRGTDSLGTPDEFRVTDRLNNPDPETVRSVISAGDRVVDELNPWRYSVVTDPSDAVGDIIVEPWTTDDHPYPAVTGPQYAISADEVVGWNGSGATPMFVF